MTTVLILCAGENSRWEPHFAKQLADLGGETVIARTVRQVRGAWQWPMVVTHRPEIVKAVDAAVFHPEMHTALLETLRSCRGEMVGNVAVLLGDVVWQDAALASVMDCTHEAPLFWGKAGEIFALTFGHGFTAHILRAIDDALVGFGALNYGKLWHLFRVVSGLETNCHEEPCGPFWRTVEGWTCDIDTIAQHEHVMALQAQGKIDLGVKV